MNQVDQTDAFNVLLSALSAEQRIGYVVHKSFKPVFANLAYAHMYGFDSVEKILGLDSLLPLLPPILRDDAKRNIQQVMLGQAGGQTHVVENQTLHGESFWVEVSDHLIIFDGEPAVLTTLNEVTDEVLKARQLEQAQQQLQTLYHETLEILPVGIAVYNQSMQLLSWNSEYCALSGIADAALQANMPLQAVLDQEYACCSDPKVPRRQAKDIIEYWNTHSASTRVDRLPNDRVVEVKGKKLADGRFVFCYLDMTERHLAEQELKTLSEQDALTGVYNRRSFQQKVNQRIKHHKKLKLPLSLMVIDLDHFKSINDEFGHSVGDSVLKSFTQLTSQSLRRGDLFGRLGGEEFCILMSESPLDHAQRIAQRLLSEIRSQSLQLAGHQLSYTASIGITVMLPDDHDFLDLFNRADEAMYRAKDLGRDQVQII